MKTLALSLFKKELFEVAHFCESFRVLFQRQANTQCLSVQTISAVSRRQMSAHKPLISFHLFAALIELFDHTQNFSLLSRTQWAASSIGLFDLAAAVEILL